MCLSSYHYLTVHKLGNRGKSIGTPDCFGPILFPALKNIFSYEK